MKPIKKSITWGRHSLTLETGEIARQATGAVLVTNAMWPALKATSQGRALGPIDLKGKGKTDLIRYLGRK